VLRGVGALVTGRNPSDLVHRRGGATAADNLICQKPGPDGISDFARLHRGKCNEDIWLYAFDLLVDDGVDMQDGTLKIRKLWLARLLKRSGDGVLYNPRNSPCL
jgi:hypothetical protein